MKNKDLRTLIKKGRSTKKKKKSKGKKRPIMKKMK